jgi:hypothetical protein
MMARSVGQDDIGEATAERVRHMGATLKKEESGVKCGLSPRRKYEV